MKKRILSILFLFFAGSFQAASATVPDIKKDCSICHIGHGSSIGILLKRPQPELCRECHPVKTGRGEHPVDIKPADTIGGLPLDQKGEMTCTTCHAPHGEGGIPMMLRKNYQELCLSCHNE